MDLTKYYPDIVAKYPAYVTKRELCEICHICPKTAYNLEQQGEIPYLRSESMITAVEENIHYLNPPVADVFRGFLAETNMISADVKQALSNMKPKLDNYVFREWVDAAIACQDDKSLKSTLTPIIGKLSDMRIVAAELDYLLYEPFKEFITMAFLLIGNIPLLYFLNKDWYDVLVNTGFGKGILAVCLLVLLISFAAVIRLTKPVEYKR